MRKNFPLILLVVLGLATRFLFIWYPDQVVFDEVHFGKFVSAYYTGEYYFDIHPPLGKLLIAGFVKFFGFRPGFDFEHIGEHYGEIPYVALRFLPNLTGALIPASLFGWLTAMGISQSAALLAGLLLIFDNAMLVQSHFLLVDAFLIFFGFAGLWLFWRARNRGYGIRDTILAGVVLAMAFSVKWTGLAFFGLAAGVMLVDLARCHRVRSERALVLFGATALFLYLAVFWVHFALLPNSGPGDAFMSADFREKTFLAKTIELNRVMYVANQGLRTSHPYGSPAWTWPLALRPVYYWVRDFSDGTMARIYFLGNPIVWWLSTFGLIAALFGWRQKSREKKWILFTGYLANMIPFFFIRRVMFLYHYLPALGFAVAIFSCWVFDERIETLRWRALWMGILAIAVAGFWFFAPLSYGLPLSEAQYTIRTWLASWR